MTNPDIIAVNLTPAMSGYFATLLRWNNEHGGFYEPYNTGIGRYATWQEANKEGEMWAKQLEIEFQPATEDRVLIAEASTKKFSAKIKRVRELREEGLNLKAALEKAISEGF